MTKLRTLFSESNRWYQGGTARRQLEQLYRHWVGEYPSRGEMPEAERLKYMFAGISRNLRNPVLYIFREPARLAFKKSRFKKLCRAMGAEVPLENEPSITMIDALLAHETRVRARVPRQPSPPSAPTPEPEWATIRIPTSATMPTQGNQWITDWSVLGTNLGTNPTSPAQPGSLNAATTGTALFTDEQLNRF